MAVPLDELLEKIVKEDASDLHLHAHRPPTMRLNGALLDLNKESLLPEDTVGYMKAITSHEHQEELAKIGSTDFGFAFKDLARFRVAVYRQKGEIALTLRLIPYKFLTFQQLGLGQLVVDLLDRPRGLVMVTGPTGSGKTTTLASMINYINENHDRHIITIEDPIEYYHQHKKSIISQRELGVDLPDFAEGLRRGLRQDPDVFLVGEMRDPETIRAAITAAETGHLVFATLHTTGASRTVDRITESFPIEEQEQIRVMLSVSILAIISQQLLPRSDVKGRVAAYEIMVATPAIANLVREKKTYRIISEIQTGMKQGMKTMDQSLLELYGAGKIDRATALDASFDREQLDKSLKMVDIDRQQAKA
ncbi:MAG TPA: type IV pilus twitching motility protein PilT [bacterium]|nr:type IV pilus twitching motility protein PilT [bacterium]HNS48955.1 type IV pilus twitching motility protein PilT [bacterium]